MFYITLTIEEDGQSPLNITPSNYGDSDMDSNTYSQMSTDSGSGMMRSITPNNLHPTVHGKQKLPPRRRKSSTKAVYSIVRPLVPPPAPPLTSTPQKISFMEPPYNICNNSFSSELSSSSSYNSI